VNQTHDAQLVIKVHPRGETTGAFAFARTLQKGAGAAGFERFPMRPVGTSRTLFEVILPRSFLQGADRVEYYFVAYEADGKAALRSEGTEQDPFSLEVERYRSLRIASHPPGASVRVDGRLLRGRTPLSGAAGRGNHHLLLQLPGFNDLNMDFNMPNDRDVQLSPTLTRRDARAFTLPGAARLTIETDPPGLPVSIDGLPAGRSPLPDRTVDPGAHFVSVDDPCMRGVNMRAQVRSGDSRLVYIAAEPQLAGVAVRAVDRTGLDFQAEVEIRSGTSLQTGRTPQRFLVPVCGTSITVTGANGKRWSAEPVLEKGQIKPVVAEFRDVLAPRDRVESRAHALPDRD
jgi:hypothetical protein